MNINLIKIFTSFIIIFLSSCQQEKKSLPILGAKTIETNGGVIDTTYKTIPDFIFIDQDSNEISQKTFQNKVYIADFFFTTCPTICPIMKTQMFRVYEKFKGNNQVAFLSHTIDPKHDTVAVLKNYADGLGVSSNQWHFVTGNRETIYDIAQNHYMISAVEDESAPGGAIHGGSFILIDKEKRIRGYYDGTNEKEVTQLINDIPFLLQEK